MHSVYLYSFLLALVFSLACFPVLIRNAARLKLIDDPGSSDRKIHKEVIPRSGGLGIVISSLLAAGVLLPINSEQLYFFMACLIIVGFGILDDYVELSPVHKLLGQSLGVIVAMAGGMVMLDMPILTGLPTWLCYVVTFIFVLAVINGVNFSDGMDGLAAGTTLMALVLIFILAVESGSSTLAIIALAVSAALLGFLRFNTHPARLFMGDSGSQFLGFCLAWLSITLVQGADSGMSRVLPLLILGIPVMDILQVVPVRIKKKLPLPGPDKEHFHHQIAKMGCYQSEVVALIYVLQTCLLTGAFVLRFQSDWVVFGAYVLFASIVLGLIFLGNTTGWKLHPQAGHAGRDNRSKFFRRLGVLHPYTHRILGFFITLMLIGSAILCTSISRPAIWGIVLVALLLLGFRAAFPNRWPLGLGRFSAFFATVLLIYGLTISMTDPTLNLAIDITMVLIAAFLAVSVRITRNYYFGLTTEDLLVGLMLLTITPVIFIYAGESTEVLRAIFRICIMFYACEYILARGDYAIDRLTLGATVAMLFTAIHL